MNCKRLLIDFIKKHIPRYIVGIAAMLATTTLNASIPKLTGEIIDTFGIQGARSAEILSMALRLALIAATAFGLRFVSRYMIMGLARNLELVLRNAIFSKFQRLSADFYVKNNTGDMITRSIIDVQTLRAMFSMGITGIFDIVTITVISISYMMATVNPVLTLIAVIPIPFILAALVYIRKLVRQRFTVLQQTISKISSKVQENITGIRVVKAFVQEDSESGIFSDFSREKWDAEMRMARVSSAVSPIVQLAFGIIFSAFVIIGGYLVVNHSISLGDYIAFNSYIMILMDPVSRASRVLMIWQRAGVSMQRIDTILTAEETVQNDRSDPRITGLSPCSIRFDHLTYQYPGTGKPVLRDLSLEVPEGGILAVMGPTGSGKSTLMNLLIRLWDLQPGMISVGGKDIGSIPLSVLRTQAAYVPQDTFLFSDTIRNNILFYDPALTQTDAEEAARAAVVHENIVGFEQGYDTVVGERGMTLSGGQKQRVAIARALARKPRLLLLDDCLSAVDSETEHAILSNLQQVVKGCTTVLVTHRISAAMLADHILLLNRDGSPGGIGTHEELLAANETYRRLYETTLAEESLGKEAD